MIASVHLAHVPFRVAPRLLLSGLQASEVPGMRYSELTLGAPLGGRLLPRPTLRRIGLIAAWSDDVALDGFLRSHPLAAQLHDGWHARLRLNRVVGEWAPLREMEIAEDRSPSSEPVVVLTLGRLKPFQALRFLRASAAAEQAAIDQPSLIASTGLARPPSLVATFSLWRDVGAMRAYVEGHAAGTHREAMRAHASDPFHRESAFMRFSPYAARGSWDGRNPLDGISTWAPTTEGA